MLLKARRSRSQASGGVLRKEDGKPKPGARSLGPFHIPPTPPGSSVALVVIHCDPLNPPGPPSPDPSGEGTGKKPVLGRLRGIFPMSPQPTLSNTTRLTVYTPVHDCTLYLACAHARTHAHTHKRTHTWAELSSRGGSWVRSQYEVPSSEYHPSSGNRVPKSPPALCTRL